MKVRMLFKEETAWLTQEAPAERFGVKLPAVRKHLKNIYDSGEQDEVATVSEMKTVATEGEQKIPQRRGWPAGGPP